MKVIARRLYLNLNQVMDKLSTVAKLLLFNKPYNVLCQFTDKQNRDCLANYINQTGYYAAGRLDYDSEGLLILTRNGALQHQISHPDKKLSKTYWVQIEGEMDKNALTALRQGVELKDGLTLPTKVKAIKAPAIWSRSPPVRFRKNIPTSWISITLTEGKNRQVRRMTSAVGLPTLRLIRYSIGPWTLEDLQPGQTRSETVHLPDKKTTRNKQTHQRKKITRT